MGEICQIRTGNKDTQDKVDDGIYPFYVRSNTIERINSYTLDEKAILTSGDGVGVGKIFHLVRGKFAIHQRVYALTQFKHNFLIDYVYYFFSEKFYKRVITLSAKNSVDSVRKNMISDMKMPYPSLLEQTKIANFLTKLDERILLQREIITQLETLIKGYLQKLFSQELRFKDENGKNFPNWAEKKLGEIGTFQTSSVDKLSKKDEKEVFLVNYMNVYRHETINSTTIKHFQIVTAKDSQILNCNLEKGDILFTPSSETPSDIGHSVVISEDIPNAVFSYHLMRFRPKIKLDILYSHYFCNISDVLKQLSKYSTGSTRFTISVKSFSEVLVNLPSLKEQTKIANFLSKLDEKLTTEKELLTELEEQKKFFLQNMFV